LRTTSQYLAFLLAVLLFPPFAAGDELPEKLQQLSRKYLETGAAADRGALSSYVETVPSAELQGFGRLALGFGDYSARNYEAAEQQLRLAPEDRRQLGDYARYYRARSLVELDNQAGAAWVVVDFQTRYAGSRLVPAAVRMRAESLIRAEQTDKAREVLAGAAKVLPEAVRLYLLGRVDELSGRLADAVENYRRVYYFYPLSEQASEAEGRLNALRNSLGSRYPGVAGDMRLARADALFDAGRYTPACSEYRLAVQGLSGKQLDRARVGIGACDYERLRTTNAYNWLSTLKVSDPESDARRLYYLVQCARRKNRTTEFENRLDEFRQKYPQSRWYEEALFALGNYYLLENDTRRYGKYYELAARSFPKGSHAAKAHWKVCWRAYLEGDPRAMPLFEEHLALYPNSNQATAAAYWLGRLAEKGGDEALARHLYAAIDRHFPHYYYSLLARQRLAEIGDPDGEPQPLVAKFLRAVSGPRALTEQIGEGTQELLRRGRLLFELGLDEDAERELLAGDYRSADAHLVGLELYRQTSARNVHYRGLRYMKRYGYGYLRLPLDSMPRAFWESLFPLPWGEELLARAAPHELDPYLVAGLIRQESEFNPQARSRAGALGLMQIMPATGRGLARRLGIPSFSTRELYRPELSLRLGTFHLKQVFDRYQNELEISLAAYNAGEHRAAKWLQWGVFDEPGKFVETIPFTETRGYVQSVLRNADVYRRLYGDAPQRPSVAHAGDGNQATSR
jgi:soluble lytic murein transglycosylase